MAKIEKTKCPTCGSSDLVTATDKSGKHYCQKCQNVWVPGLETAGRSDLVLARAQKDLREMREALDAARAEIRVLIAKNEAQAKEIRKLKGEAEPEPSEEEIFS